MRLRDGIIARGLIALHPSSQTNSRKCDSDSPVQRPRHAFIILSHGFIALHPNLQAASKMCDSDSRA